MTWRGKLANDTKLSAAVDTPEGSDAIQRETDRPERWVCVNLMALGELTAPLSS